MVNRRIGVYWQTWSTSWSDKSESMDLYSKLDSKVGVVYLAFAQCANNTYKSQSKTFAGTGLQFSQSWDVVTGAIKLLRDRGTIVMLSVGGASYPFTIDNGNFKSCCDLARDLGCDGIDIDWEPANPSQDSWQFGAIINAFKVCMWPGGELSAAVWSSGADDPAVGSYSGMNVQGLKSNGSQLDWINIMSYDAGVGYSAIEACKRYQKIYTGKIYLGLQVGKQGWGDALLSWPDVVSSVNYVSGLNGGIFIWSYQKDHGSTPSVSEILYYADDIMYPEDAPPRKPETGGGGGGSGVPQLKLKCPNCSYEQTITSK